MANPEHLKILKQGVEAWNEWRAEHPNVAPDLVLANLGRASLGGADLTGADLSGANLVGANLEGANLVGAYLAGANLGRAYLAGANLAGANLVGADLHIAYLSWAHLSGTNLSRAVLAGTVFIFDDLSTVKGLESVQHEGPSAVDIDTIFRSKGNIPESFLRGAGVPEDFIVYMKSLVGKAIEFYSCFISYSSRDQDFADRLYEGLKAKDVRCWYFPEDAKWGEPVWGEIDRSIKVYDKLVVICSENSLESQPVIREIERALQREDREHKNVLFPVRIDDYLFGVWQHPRKADVESKVVGDFREWKDHDAYTKAFNRLLEALNRPEK